MSTQNADRMNKQLDEMAAAVSAQDLDGLLAFYDDELVFIEGANVMDKDGLADYLKELWTSQPEFSVALGASHAVDDVLGVTLEASMPVETSSGEVVPVHWPILVLYTFDLTTMKVVRELAFSDEEALNQKLAALGVA